MSGLRRTRRAGVRINRYPGRGRRERWNGRYQVRSVRRCPGLERGRVAGTRTWARKVPEMEGAGVPAVGGASGHLDDPQGYSTGRAREKRTGAAQGDVQDEMNRF